MGLADIHIHLLFGVDDGAKDEDEMHAILDAAYQAGTRVLCCTPHFHPGYFGDNYDKVNAAFKRLSSYVQKTYPDMALYLGNELRYEPECVNSCMSGALSKNRETGIVEYDEKQCAGCFMCVMNCPFGVLKPDNTARSRIIKCDFCKDSGSEPSCVKACPKKAIWIEEVES